MKSLACIPLIVMQVSSLWIYTKSKYQWIFFFINGYFNNHFSYESDGESFPLTIHKYFITVDRCLILQTMWLFVFYTLTHSVQIQKLFDKLINTTNSILVSLKQLWQTRLKKNQIFGHQTLTRPFVPSQWSTTFDSTSLWLGSLVKSESCEKIIRCIEVR